MGTNKKNGLADDRVERKFVGSERTPLGIALRKEFFRSDLAHLNYLGAVAAADATSWAPHGFSGVQPPESYPHVRRH